MKSPRDWTLKGRVKNGVYELVKLVEQDSLPGLLRLQIRTFRNADEEQELLPFMAGELVWVSPCCRATPSLAGSPRCTECGNELWRSPQSAYQRRGADFLKTADTFRWTEGEATARALLESWAPAHEVEPLSALVASSKLMDLVEHTVADFNLSQLRDPLPKARHFGIHADFLGEW